MYAATLLDKHNKTKRKILTSTVHYCHIDTSMLPKHLKCLRHSVIWDGTHSNNAELVSVPPCYWSCEMICWPLIHLHTCNLLKVPLTEYTPQIQISLNTSTQVYGKSFYCNTIWQRNFLLSHDALAPTFDTFKCGMKACHLWVPGWALFPKGF